MIKDAVDAFVEDSKSPFKGGDDMMVAPAADFDIQDASPLWGLEDAANLANISGNFNVNEINKKVYGGQDKVFDFDEILDD